MNRYLILICLAAFLISCKRFYVRHLVSKEKWENEKLYVEHCRNQWSYLDLKDTLKIEVIDFKNQWGHSVVHFPSFFIGITSNKDTVGIIDYDFNSMVEIGEELKFAPGISRYEPEKRLNGHRPCFSVSHKRELNKINCSITNVFYGVLISKTNHNN